MAVVCPKCSRQFDPSPKRGRDAAIRGAMYGGMAGSMFGIAGGPLGAIAGTIPGAVVGSALAFLGVRQFAACKPKPPGCGKVFLI